MPGDPESTSLLRLAQKRQQEEASSRAWLTQGQENAEQRAEQSRQEAVQVLAAEAEERGFCFDCLAHSTDWGLHLASAKRTRHRKPENCPLTRRGTNP